MSKKKRQAIKRRQQAETGLQGNDVGSQQENSKVNTGQNTQDEGDEYDIMQFEDEFDQDTQSLNENEKEEEETSRQLIKAFGSTMFQQEIQEVSNQQGLSPRGRQNSKKANTNTSANSSRPNTRSRSREEKLGGLPYNMNKSFDFLSVIETCGLIDIGYSGQHFTWCNQRAEEARVWKRLDRAMVNDKWLEVMPQTTITHLPSRGAGQPYVETASKMKRLATTFSAWSRKEFGDIFSAVRSFEKQSILIHTMASISPPKTTLNYIKRVTADFFWGCDKEKKKYHWASWETLSYPFEEGGIGVKKLEDMQSSSNQAMVEL
ncbi:hypothetical protein MTR67_043460 [Solanum verrucosum]|uniref:Uncharacterized protein n=1 Tax=Solanum verrucosum TaxID=315347 RepID=A0AAF0ZUQ6_SOLVR|nr:hypothetical protein MTR67_043460 [Solanum verrucosum]